MRNFNSRICKLIFAILLSNLASAAHADPGSGIVQYGKMHEVIGQKKHDGRVLLREVVQRPHFFGVGALEKLYGEVTIVDGEVLTSRVNANGQVESSEGAKENEKAALLIGAYVSSWSEPKVAGPLEASELEDFIAVEAKNAALDDSEPFVFRIEGELTNLRMHVINGACPLHARLKNLEIPAEERPYETEAEKARGTIVGVYAKEAVGDSTHPATAAHMHVIIENPTTGEKMTGHVERVGLGDGATLRLQRSEKPALTLRTGSSISRSRA